MADEAKEKPKYVYSFQEYPKFLPEQGVSVNSPEEEEAALGGKPKAAAAAPAAPATKAKPSSSKKAKKSAKSK
jgi:hypothetical protein